MLFLAVQQRGGGDDEDAELCEYVQSRHRDVSLSQACYELASSLSPKSKFLLRSILSIPILMLVCWQEPILTIPVTLSKNTI